VPANKLLLQLFPQEFAEDDVASWVSSGRQKLMAYVLGRVH
jgi:hypothetical protein